MSVDYRDAVGQSVKIGDRVVFLKLYWLGTIVGFKFSKYAIIKHDGSGDTSTTNMYVKIYEGNEQGIKINYNYGH